MSKICAVIVCYAARRDRAPSAPTTKELIAGLAGNLGHLIPRAPASYRSWDLATTKLGRQLRDQFDAQFLNRLGSDA